MADAKTSEVLRKFQTGSRIVAPQVTWQDYGGQYLAVASGWGGVVPMWGGDVAGMVSLLEKGRSMWVFKLAK